MNAKVGSRLRTAISNVGSVALFGAHHVFNDFFDFRRRESTATLSGRTADRTQAARSRIHPKRSNMADFRDRRHPRFSLHPARRRELSRGAWLCFSAGRRAAGAQEFDAANCRKWLSAVVITAMHLRQTGNTRDPFAEIVIASRAGQATSRTRGTLATIVIWASTDLRLARAAFLVAAETMGN